jgi:small subunit ribosomal protein S6
MPANVYECMFLLDPNKVAGDVAGAAKQLHTIIERHHAEILASRQWSEHKLAFQISHHKKGIYYLIYFRAEGKALRPIEQDCALTEMILRQLVLKIHPKLVDLMLAVARDEHALALHTATDPDGEAGVDELGLDGGGEHHRPHRGGGGGGGGRRRLETADKG